jgi:hypothetical protein
MSSMQEYEQQQAQETQGFLFPRVQLHILKPTSPLRNPQRVDLYT